MDPITVLNLYLNWLKLNKTKSQFLSPGHISSVQEPYGASGYGVGQHNP